MKQHTSNKENKNRTQNQRIRRDLSQNKAQHTKESDDVTGPTPQRRYKRTFFHKYTIYCITPVKTKYTVLIKNTHFTKKY